MSFIISGIFFPDWYKSLISVHISDVNTSAVISSLRSLSRLIFSPSASDLKVLDYILVSFLVFLPFYNSYFHVNPIILHLKQRILCYSHTIYPRLFLRDRIKWYSRPHKTQLIFYRYSLFALFRQNKIFYK